MPEDTGGSADGGGCKRTYLVTLSGIADVYQRQEVQAQSRAEAMKIARERMNDNVWKYNGVIDVLVDSITPV
jgi:hypothetical protein